MYATQNIDTRRETVAALIPSERKAELGQFMTPLGIASFMARMFGDVRARSIRLLDAGAGIGSLTATFADMTAKAGLASLHCSTWEIDPFMRKHLAETLEACREIFSGTPATFSSKMYEEDFILSASESLRGGAAPRFTHAILNPPYKKLKSVSEHRKALRSVGIETSNLYTAFVALSLMMLEDGGELVAITPRSFCNGTYFKPFRKMLLNLSSVRHVHVFEARSHAFKGDSVLQENIILHVVKGIPQGDVVLSSSGDASFSDITEKRLPFSTIVEQDDEEKIIHLPIGDDAAELERMMMRFPHSLADIGIGVSTGPVVDFRLKPHLRQRLSEGCVPLIYCANFADGFVSYPKQRRKPSAIAENEETSRWLMPSGYYVLIRRLSSKEEKRRLVPSLFDPAKVHCLNVGFENHINVFHEAKRGLPPLVARGLTVYLSSTFADRWFRRFNGHTQVNAGDLRALRYPDRKTLEDWGKQVGDRFPPQEKIDEMVEGGE